MLSQMKELECVVDEGPPKKKPRTRSKGGPVERKQMPRKCKKVRETPPLNLCDLPTEILEKIIGNVNIWHHNRIRGTCRRLKHVDDIFVMHEFQKVAQEHIRRYPQSESSAAFRVIKIATEVFVQSGFDSMFCSCILPMLRSNYEDAFCLNYSQIRKFLGHFYRMVADRIGDTSSQRWGLLYTVTLMQLTKAFDKSILSSRIRPQHWRVSVELRGPWMGNLWSSKCRTPNQLKDPSNLLIILAEMLIANMADKCFKYLWDCPNEMYVIGNDAGKSNRVPLTIFTFTVNGPQTICNLLRSCLEEGPENFQLTSNWPNDEFTVNLDIICKQAVRWGCSKSQHMVLGPFSRGFYGAENYTENNIDSETNV